MSDALALMGLLALVSLLPASSLLSGSRRHRLIVGGIGLAVGIICQLIGDDAVLYMVLGYCFATGALMAEVVRWCFGKLGAWVRAALEQLKAPAKDKS